MVELGEAIRDRRGELGLTLEGLAERAGVSRAMLSEIERGVKTPTIRTLSQIAAGLGTTVGQLIGEAPARDELQPDVLRLAERPTLVEPRTGIVRQMLAPALQPAGLAIAWWIIPPGQRTEPASGPHPRRALHITVIQGTLRCALGHQEIALAAGDSLTFTDDTLLTFHNPDAEACHFLLVGRDSQD